MSRGPELSIVVLCKDEATRLPAFFAALKPLQLDHEVLLVDSGSRDRSAAIARENHPNSTPTIGIRNPHTGKSTTPIIEPSDT